LRSFTAIRKEAAGPRSEDHVGLSLERQGQNLAVDV
jgi:hypothetical protein